MSSNCISLSFSPPLSARLYPTRWPAEPFIAPLDLAAVVIYFDDNDDSVLALPALMILSSCRWLGCRWLGLFATSACRRDCGP